MYYIKIFIASSISEFRAQRMELGDYIRSLNDIYVRRGIYFELVLSEDLSNTLASGRKQDEINREISDSRFFYILIGQKAGPYTLEEFDCALERSRECGSPRIYTYFYRSPEDRTPEQSTIDFMERLDKRLGHYYCLFENLDAIKLNLLIELARDESVRAALSVQDGQAVIEGKSILSLENVPAFGRHTELRRLQAQKAELDGQLMRLRNAVAASPGDEKLFSELLSVARRRDDTAALARQIESDVLKLCSTIQSLGSSGRPMTLREKEAGRLLNQGDFDGALRVLRDEERKKELEQARQIVASGRERILGYISENRLQIQALKSKGITEKTIPEILDCYEENIGLAEQYRLCPEEYYGYACFLMDHNRHADAIRVLERSLKILGEEIPPEQLADTEYLLACLMYKANRIDESIALHRSSLSRREALAWSGDPGALGKLASSCNQMGYLFFRLNRPEEARRSLDEAIRVQEGLLAKDPRPQLRSALALSLNNLAQLEQREGRLEAAEQHQLRALALREELAKDETVASRGFLAMSCLNYARLLAVTKEDPAPAEAYFKRAIGIYAELSEVDTKHLVDRAIAEYHYACFLEERDGERALALHRKALQMRRMLAKTNLGALRSDLSDSCFAVGRLLASRGSGEAEEYLKEALAMQRELYEAAPEKFSLSYRKMKEAAARFGIGE